MNIFKAKNIVSETVNNYKFLKIGGGNLIICPLALLQHWKQEIYHKINLPLTVCIYHASSSPIENCLER